MKRAVIHLQISIHELKGQELREVLPANEMKENGLQISKVVSFDDVDTFHICKKVREWLELAK